MYFCLNSDAISVIKIAWSLFFFDLFDDVRHVMNKKSDKDENANKKMSQS